MGAEKGLGLGLLGLVVPQAGVREPAKEEEEEVAVVEEGWCWAGVRPPDAAKASKPPEEKPWSGLWGVRPPWAAAAAVALP